MITIKPATLEIWESPELCQRIKECIGDPEDLSAAPPTADELEELRQQANSRYGDKDSQARIAGE